LNSYKRLSTEAYDIDKPVAPESALNFYLGYAEDATQPILEPMCGSGRFLVPLLERGFDIDGVDASPHMLESCRTRCRERGLTPTLYEQFLHNMEVPRAYGLVFIPAGSLSLIIDRDRLKESLRRIHAVMLPGAKFLAEVVMPPSDESHNWPWGGRWFQRPDGAKIVLSWLGHYDAGERVSRNIHRYELIKDGRLLETEFEDFDIRHYDPPEFQAVLETGGFTDVRVVRRYGSEENSAPDEEIVFECTRP
jgi:hypothetical protein